MSDSGTTAQSLLHISQAAREYSISKQTLWRWIRSGRLPAFRPFASRKLLVKRADLEVIIEASRVRADVQTTR